MGEESPSPSRRSKSKNYLLVQALLCVLCTVVGAFYPTLLDWSKTAFEQEVFSGHTKETRAYPFSPASVVLVNDALQLSLALFAVSLKLGLSSIFKDGSLILKMLPLGLIYAVGELLTLRSVQKGSGPVYVVIANMKLVVAAVMSRLFFGQSRSLPLLHWLELVFISFLAALYTLAEVFCEHTYKNNSFLVVLALQAFWGLATMLLLLLGASLSMPGYGFLGGVALELRDDAGNWAFFSGGPWHPLCDSPEHLRCVHHLAARESCICITERGWDSYTFLAVFADLSNAVSSALVFRRLSAVAKYVCRASSAVPMYIFYCAVGRALWDAKIFGIVLLLCLQIGIYTVQRHRAEAEAEEAEEAAWAQEYTRNGGPKKSA
ncbi:unnamed protein product [Durusdinium trenchii]|uniref:Uncharacterized protein n=1 Tax=Durusdinium trenchii TaxID=1381693 RepID=A0ABP0LMY0_9DINO